MGNTSWWVSWIMEVMALLGKSERGLARECLLFACSSSSFGLVYIYSPGMLLAHPRTCWPIDISWDGPGNPKTISFGLPVYFCRGADKLLSLKLTGSSVVVSR